MKIRHDIEISIRFLTLISSSIILVASYFDFDILYIVAVYVFVVDHSLEWSDGLVDEVYQKASQLTRPKSSEKISLLINWRESCIHVTLK